MRIELKELLDKLGVGYILSAYETCPWAASDDETGVTCSAEVRMNNDGNELEAEMQIMRDNPAEGESPLEQIFFMLAKPATDNKWDVKTTRVQGQDNPDNLYNWHEKAAAFFLACVTELKMGKIPDIEEIMARELRDGESFGGMMGGGGSKSPKLKGAQLLGMKTGR
ncbi:MAG: hypothetical protein MRY79_01175 [Alphaproteobacteria bacterium]|nr:hypothetical protein [Alphaproteobacteria bacterium]